MPLIERAEVVAALGVSRAAPYTDLDVDLVQSFAAQASLVLAHHRTSTDLRRLELIEDRERIGRDLHDTVIQRLFATGLSLQALSRRCDDRPEVAERLARAVDDIDDTVKQIRSTIFALQEPSKVASVRSELLAVVDEVGASLARSPRVRFRGPIDTLVGPHLAEHLVPVVREALTNAARHAGAEHLVLDVHADPEGLEVRVTDDGRGFDPHATAGHGLGLANLRERARVCGGTVRIVTPPSGQGTEVSWCAPLSGPTT